MLPYAKIKTIMQIDLGFHCILLKVELKVDRKSERVFGLKMPKHLAELKYMLKVILLDDNYIVRLLVSNFNSFLNEIAKKYWF